MKKDGIILDVDGTLWDTTKIVAEAWNQALRQGGIHDITVTADILKKQFGKTMDIIADNLFGTVPAEERYELMKECCRLEHHALHENEACLLYPGVEETLKTLREKENLFIVSNCQSGYIELFLEKNQLAHCIMDMECYGNTGKSKGENIKLLVERNNLKEPVYVGDTEGDREASVYAGVPFIFASYGFGSVTEYAARIENFSQLLQI